jgi:hypothetical protein
VWRAACPAPAHLIVGEQLCDSEPGGTVREGMSRFRASLFCLGVCLERHRVLRVLMAALGHLRRWTRKAVRWAVIATLWVVGVVGAIYILMHLNYAPLWSRSYSECVESQFESPSISEALRRRSSCTRRASDAVEKQMRLDQTPRGPERR